MTTPKPKPAIRTQRGFSLAHKLPPPSGEYHWVYLWEWPIRVMHWLAVACILALVVTGLYIGMPYFVVAGDTAQHYLMGEFRFVHFAAAAVLVATAVVRGYWLFAGNKFERLSALPAAYVVEFVKRQRVLGRTQAVAELDELIARSGQIGSAADSDHD